MKTFKILSFLFAISIAIVSCGGEPPVIQPPKPGGDDSTNVNGGNSSLEDPFSVEDAIENNTGKGYVKGYIVGYYNFDAEGDKFIAGSEGCEVATNILIADETGELVYDGYLAVEIRGEFLNKLNLQDNPTNIGKEVTLYGTLMKYCGVSGLKSLEYGVFGDVEMGTKPGTVTETEGEGTLANPFTTADITKLNSTKPGPYYVKAYIVGQLPGMKMDDAEFDSPWSTATDQTYNTNIIIAASASETNTTSCIPVQLPSGALRIGLNLPENPDMEGKEIIIYGELVPYFGAAGIKNASYAKVGDTEFGIPPTDTSDAIFTETFSSSLGNFTTKDVVGSKIWEYASSYKCAKATGYKSTKQDGEGWLISPAIDLSAATAATLTFQNAGNYFTTPSEELQIWVSTTSNDPTVAAEWTQLTVDEYSTGGFAWALSTIAIDDYCGNASVHFAFRYFSTPTMCGTWEIKDFVIK